MGGGKGANEPTNCAAAADLEFTIAIKWGRAGRYVRRDLADYHHFGWVLGDQLRSHLVFLLYVIFCPSPFFFLPFKFILSLSKPKLACCCPVYLYMCVYI